MPGRVVGTVMVAVVLCGPDVLLACGRVVGCSTTTGCGPLASDSHREVTKSGLSGPWWKRRHSLSPAQVILLSSLGGIAVGCGIAVYLGGPNLQRCLIFGGMYGVLATMIAATQPLLDVSHPHHRRFMASCHHVFSLAFVVIFALGFWHPPSSMHPADRAALARHP